MFRLIFLSILIMTFYSRSSTACSVFSVKIPSGFELTQIVDSIIVAKVLGSKNDPTLGHSVLKIKVLEQLKGTPSDKTSIHGYADSDFSSPEYNIAGSHHGGGSCTRLSYVKGNKVIFFLSKDKKNGSFNRVNYTFARNAEDIIDENSPWYIAVKKFVSIQSSNKPMEQLDALNEWKNQLITEPRTQHNTALIESILSHLLLPSRYQPTEYLIESYKRLKAKQPLKYASNKHDEFLTEDFKQGLFVFNRANEVTTEYLMREIALGHHPEAINFILHELNQKPDLSNIPPIIDYLTKNNKLFLALETFEKYLLQIHAHPNTYRQYELENSWRNLVLSFAKTDLNSETAERLFSIYHYYTNINGYHYWSGKFLPILNKIRPTDYSKSIAISHALARENDKEILSWAKNQLSSEFNWDTDKFPIQLLVNSIRDIDDPLLTTFLCSTTPRRQIAIKAMEIEYHHDLKELLLQIARFENLDVGDTRALLQKVRYRLVNPHVYGNSDFYEMLIIHLKNGTKPPKPNNDKYYKDIDCNSVKDNPLFIP